MALTRQHGISQNSNAAILFYFTCLPFRQIMMAIPVTLVVDGGYTVQVDNAPGSCAKITFYLR